MREEVEESQQNFVLEAESTLRKALDMKRNGLIYDSSIEGEIEKTARDVITSQGRPIICIQYQRSLVIPGSVMGKETKTTDLPACYQNWIQELILRFDKHRFKGRIIFDIISERSLKKAIFFGAKILHLEQFFHKPGYLLVDDAFTGRLCQFGVMEILKMIGADRVSGQSKNGDGQDSDFEESETNINGKTLKHTFDCLVLAFPQSQKLAHFFKRLGVNYVVYFKERSMFTNEPTIVAIQKFCLTFYQKLLEEFSVKAAFDDAILNSETKSGFQPVLLERDSQIHQKKLFESSQSKSNTNLISEGQIHDLSFERCPFTNINMKFKRLNGQQLKLYQVLMFLTSQEGQQPTLLHVQDDRKDDGLSFLQEVACCTLERDMIQRQIYYEDLSQIRTQQQLKNMLLRLHLSNNESELYKTYRQIQPVETLLLFENLEKLPPRLVEGFEIRLVNLLQKYKGIRCLTSSKEQFSFQQFVNHSKNDQSNQQEEYKRLNYQRLVIQSQYENVLVNDAEPENSSLTPANDSKNLVKTGNQASSINTTLGILSEYYKLRKNIHEEIFSNKKPPKDQDQVNLSQNAKELLEEQEMAEAMRFNTDSWDHQLDSIPSIAEKNIVYLLNMFPDGLTELELRKLCQDYPNWFGDYEKLNILLEMTREPQQYSELPYQKLINVRHLNNDVKQLCYQINRKSRDSVANKFDKLPFIQWCNEEETENLTSKFKLMAIEFANQQARSYLLSIMQGERIDNYQNYQLATVHQDCEMWQSAKYGKTKPEAIEQPIERFTEYMRQNFERFIDKQKWLQPFEGQTEEEIKDVDELLSDLSLVLLSIEIELQPRNLDYLATKVKKCLALNEHPQNLLFYQLRLMQVSILVRQNKFDSEDLLQKLFNVRKAFEGSELGLSKSLAETYFLEAFIRMKILGRADDDEAKKKINILFEQAYEMYKQSSQSIHDDSFACNSEFGQAKVLLEQTMFSLLKSSFDQEQFQTQIDKAKEAERIFSARKRPDLEAMSIIQQVKLLLRRSEEVEESSQNSVREKESTLSKALEIQRDRLINDSSIEEEIRKTQEDVKHSQGKPIIFILDQRSLMMPGDITGEATQIPDFSDFNRNWIEQLKRHFGNNKSNGRIIFDIISERSLRKAIHFGANILHLEQFVHKQDHLLVEDAYTGRLLQLDVDQILKIIGEGRGSGQSENGDGQDSDFEESETNIDAKTLKHSFDCLVLAFPHSGTLAHFFKQLGVDHVVYFKSEEGSVPTDEPTIDAIQKFCLTFYQKLLEEFSVKAAFDDAIQSSETKSGFQPVLLERDSQRDQKQLFESFPSDSNTNLIFQGQVHDVSFERCPFTNINMKFERLNGQQLKLHQVLMFLTSQEGQQPTLLHVQDDRKDDGLSFLQEVAYCTLERDMIQRQIYYEDLNQIRTQHQLKNMLLRLHLDKNESKLYRTYRQIQPVETLLLFENIEKLPLRLVEGFEIRLVDLLQKYKGIRCLTSSKEQFSFQQFTNPNEPDPSNKKENYERLNCKRLVIQSAKRKLIDSLKLSPNEQYADFLVQDAEPKNYSSTPADDSIKFLGTGNQAGALVDQVLISQNDNFQIAPEMIDIMMNNSLEPEISQSNDMKYCIRRNCDGIGYLSENNFFCGKCNLEICWYCKVASTFGHECVGEQKEKTEEEFKQLVKQGLLQKCPGKDCPIYVQKQNEDNQVKCEFCRTEFCFKCGAIKAKAQLNCACD